MAGPRPAVRRSTVTIRVIATAPLKRPDCERAGMVLTLRTLLLLIAVILFAVAAFGVDVGGISLVALGLALFAASFIVPDTALGTRR